MKNTAGIILAAGKGTRLNSTTKNKVMHKVGSKPMIGHTVEILSKAGVKPIIVVVGFAKSSITSYFKNKVSYAEQKNPKGTAHAAACGLNHLNKLIKDVVVVYGDDSYCYPPELLAKLVKRHKAKKADLTMLTIKKENPIGLGRILRNNKDKVIGIVEHKNATERQRKIKEINTGCYVFNVDFLREFLPKVKKDPISGEYYLTDLVGLAVANKKNVEAVRGNKIPWRGVNTKEELSEARRLMGNHNEKFYA